jgi:peptidoglycan/LPS O-acetylase OafA/YrhL
MHRSQAPPTPAAGFRYQPALDGLRGIAVLAVLAYHANLPFAPGGFLGVDVFFVLSGYLITSLLLAEWAGTGGIDLGRFWVRRARRLLPALLLALAVVAVYAAVAADPAQYDRLRADGLATLAYIANWQPVLAEVSYFDQFQDPSPLRHTWSLGIEEQYYLVWPLLLLAALTLLTRVRARSGGRNGAPSTSALTARRLGWPLLGTALAAVGSALLMATLYVPGADPSRVYYGTDTRAQALLVGGALAFLAAWRAAGADRRRTAAPPGQARWPRARRLAGSLAAVSGPAALGLLALAFVAVHDRDGYLYRGGLLAVALLAAVVIAASVREGGPVRRLLAVRPLRLVGVVSYGLYLWHWPVYVLLTPDRTGWSGGTLLAARLAVTAAVTVASYVLVERPIRRGPVRAGRGLVAAAGAVTATVCVLVLATTGVRTPLPGTALAAPTNEDLPGAGSQLGDPGPVVAPGVPARVTPPGAGPGGERPAAPLDARDRDLRVFIGGDSVGVSLTVNVTPDMLAEAGMRVVNATELGCGIARAPQFIDGQPRSQPQSCASLQEMWRGRLEGFEPDVAVVIAGAWEVYDKYERGRVLQAGTTALETYLQRELDSMLRTLTDGGAGKVLLTNVPCYSAPDTGLNSDALVRNDPDRGAWVNDVFERFADRHRGTVSILDLRAFLCGGPDGNEYADRIGGVKVRGDGVHFTPAGADLVWAWLVEQINDAARSPGPAAADTRPGDPAGGVPPAVPAAGPGTAGSDGGATTGSAGAGDLGAGSGGVGSRSGGGATGATRGGG